MRKFLKFHALFAALAVAVALCLGAAPEAQAQEFTLRSIEVKGNQRISRETILNHAGLAVNRRVSYAQLNDAYQRMLRTGLFETVEVSPRGRVVTITVVEYPIINQIAVEGNRRLGDEALIDLIGSEPRRVYTPAQAEADATIIAEAYRQAGRLSAKVTPKIIRRDSNRVDLVFEVYEGNVVEIERIGFVGNRSYSDSRLRRALQTKQTTLLRNIIQRDTFIEDRIEFDKQVLRDFYNSRGFIDFEILSVTSELTRDEKGVFVTYRIQEGQPYEFGRVTISSDLDDVSPDIFEDAIYVGRGVTYTQGHISNMISRMQEIASRQGLQFLSISPDVSRDEENLSLDVNLRISRGRKVFVERIEITGNTTTLDRVVRQQFRTVEGDPFNPRQIRNASDRIRQTGFFSNTDIQAREGSTPDQVVLDVGLEEQPTGSLSFGLSYSGTDGAGLNLSFAERNLMGRGQAIRASLNSGGSSNQLNVSFTEPHIMGSDLNGTIGGYYRTTEYSSDGFDTRGYGLRLSSSFPAGRNSSLGVRYNYGLSQQLTSSLLISRLAYATADDVVSSTYGATYSYDTRRSGLTPGTGYLASLSMDYAGLGGSGDVENVTTRGELGYRTTIFREEVILRADLSAGVLNSLQGPSRPGTRFSLGGQLRGFERGGLGPRDLRTNTSLGGNKFVLGTVETEFSIGVPDEYGIRGGLFYDVGTSWDLDDVQGGARVCDSQGYNSQNCNYSAQDAIVDDSQILRSVIGFSIFWRTQIGPLRLNWTRALEHERYDRTRNFNLTISSQF